MDTDNLSDRRIIGFNPVYETTAPPQSVSVTRKGLPIVLVGTLLASVVVLSAGGGFLWRESHKSSEEIQSLIDAAVFNERARISECIQKTEQKPTVKPQRLRISN